MLHPAYTSTNGCTICNSTLPSLLLCSRCKSTPYCSPACQTLDYPVHKLLCAIYTTFLSSTPRPSPSHVLVLLFPETTPQPTLHWADTTKRHPGDLKTYLGQLSDIKTLLGTSPRGENPKKGMKKGDVMLMVSVFKNRVRKRKLGHLLELEMRDAFSRDGSLTNQCIRRALGGKMGFDFKGPFVIAKRDQFDQERYLDVTLRDFRDAVDWFGAYREDGGYSDDEENDNGVCDCGCEDYVESSDEETKEQQERETEEAKVG